MTNRQTDEKITNQSLIILKFYRGNFAETTYGKICLLIPLEPNQVHIVVKK